MPPVHEYVCRKCREPVKKGVTRCRHCGYQRKHGTAFNLVGLLNIFNPFGWAMLSDNTRKKPISVKKK